MFCLSGIIIYIIVYIAHYSELELNFSSKDNWVFILEKENVLNNDWKENVQKIDTAVVGIYSAFQAYSV